MTLSLLRGPVLETMPPPSSAFIVGMVELRHANPFLVMYQSTRFDGKQENLQSDE